MRIIVVGFSVVLGLALIVADFCADDAAAVPAIYTPPAPTAIEQYRPANPAPPLASLAKELTEAVAQVDVIEQPLKIPTTKSASMKSTAPDYRIPGVPYQTAAGWRQDHPDGSTVRLHNINGQQVWVSGQFCLPGASDWSDEPPKPAQAAMSSPCANGQCSVRRGRGW